MTAPFASPPRPLMAIHAQTEGLTKIWKRANEHERAMLAEMHQHFENETRRLVDDGNPLQNIAHTLHGLIDASVSKIMKTANGRKVSCKRGCSACCFLHVNVTQPEAVLLAGIARREGIAVDWRKVERQAPRDLAEWNDQPAHERRCMFLGNDNACRVYEHRPAACRKYQVISPAKYCDTVRFPGHEVAILAAPEAEVITSAAINVLDSGSLPRMLLAAHLKEGEGDE